MAIRKFAGIGPDLGDNVYIDDFALVIGNTKLGDDVSFWPYAVARGDVASIEVGARTNIQDHSVLHVSHDSEFAPGGRPLKIGCDVTVGHRATLHGCTVGDLCLIGMGATVMDGAVLEPEIILGAGSLVGPDKHLESGFLYRGIPARQARPITDQERAFLRYSAEHYAELKNRHMGSSG